jgi:hypothetical protein
MQLLEKQNLPDLFVHAAYEALIKCPESDIQTKVFFCLIFSMLSHVYASLILSFTLFAITISRFCGQAFLNRVLMWAITIKRIWQ